MDNCARRCAGLDHGPLPGSGGSEDIPVTLPPGRAMLLMMPEPRGPLWIICVEFGMSAQCPLTPLIATV
jgi:hypothetical protein